MLQQCTNIINVHNNCRIAVIVDNWAAKALRRRTTGTGRQRYLKHVQARAKNNFRESRGRPQHLVKKQNTTA